MNIFVLKVVVSFFVGGAFIGLLTLFAERVPLKYRGLILTMPSTLAVGLFFIGLTKSPADVSQTVIAATASLLISSYLFVATFAFLSHKYNFVFSLLFAFIVWSISTFLILTFTPSTFINALLVGIPFLFISYLIVSKLPQITTITPVPFKARHILIRSVLGGSIVVVTILLAKILGNKWGGIFVNFPAMFSTTFLIYYFTHGKQIIPSVSKSLFFPGSITFALYGLTAGFVFPIYGIWMGTLISYLAVFIFQFLWVQFDKKLAISRNLADKA